MASRASTCTAPDTFVPKTQTTSPTTARFQRFSPRWSVFWAPHHPKLRPQSLKTGGMTPSKAPTRRRHAVRRLRMAQNPHYRPNRGHPMACWARTHRLRQPCVTNVVNLSRKTSIFNEKGVGLTTFVTTTQESPQKLLGLTTFVTKHKQAHPIGGHREAYGARLRCRWAAAGPGRGSRRRTSTRQHTGPHWCGGRRRDRRARAGFEARRRTK